MKVSELSDKVLMHEYIATRREEKELYLRKKEIETEMENRYKAELKRAGD